MVCEEGMRWVRHEGMQSNDGRLKRQESGLVRIGGSISTVGLSNSGFRM